MTAGTSGTPLPRRVPASTVRTSERHNVDLLSIYQSPARLTHEPSENFHLAQSRGKHLLDSLFSRRHYLFLLEGNGELLILATAQDWSLLDIVHAYCPIVKSR